MVKEAAGISAVVWPKDLPIKQIVRLTNSKNFSSLDDYREVVEEERRLLKRDGPQDSNTTDDDGLKESDEDEEEDDE